MVKNKIITNKCEWCKTQYPEFDRTVIYYKINVFGKEHKICNECKNRLKVIRSVKE